jgi:hypothetical protein
MTLQNTQSGQQYFISGFRAPRDPLGVSAEASSGSGWRRLLQDNLPAGGDLSWAVDDPITGTAPYLGKTQIA